jgi:hypothetical protein
MVLYYPIFYNRVLVHFFLLESIQDLRHCRFHMWPTLLSPNRVMQKHLDTVWLPGSPPSRLSDAFQQR